MTHRSHVLIAGAGVAGLEAALALRELAADAVTVELVSPEADFSYRPLAVSEPFGRGETRRFPLEQLVEATGAALRSGSVASVDAERKLVGLADGSELAYDSLLLALGARPLESVPGALTFRGAEDAPALAALLEDAVDGRLRRLVFAAPAGASWPLPAYELALLASLYLSDRGARAVEIVLTTPEDQPLGIFGPAASGAVRELLELRGVRLELAVAPRRFDDGLLWLIGDRRLPADAVVALPQLEGPRLRGVRGNGAGFVATDEFGWVLGLADVYAAGDITQFPVKQGGIATQQADSAASAIAADAGAAVRPAAFTPVLRGLLFTGLSPRFLRSGVDRRGSTIDTEPLWWPPAKIVGRHLAPFLARFLGEPQEPPAAAEEHALPIEIELDATGQPVWSRV